MKTYLKIEFLEVDTQEPILRLRIFKVPAIENQLNINKDKLRYNLFVFIKGKYLSLKNQKKDKHKKS